jgi:hypothetical protein
VIEKNRGIFRRKYQGGTLPENLDLTGRKTDPSRGDRRESHWFLLAKP